MSHLLMNNEFRISNQVAVKYAILHKKVCYDKSAGIRYYATIALLYPFS